MSLSVNGFWEQGGYTAEIMVFQGENSVLRVSEWPAPVRNHRLETNLYKDTNWILLNFT